MLDYPGTYRITCVLDIGRGNDTSRVYGRIIILQVAPLYQHTTITEHDTKEIIEKAIEGGWEADADWINSLPAYAQKQVICDPTFWQALNKSLEWEGKIMWGQTMEGGLQNNLPLWMYNAHRFYDLILTGGDTGKFWADLLAKDQS